MKVKVAPNVLCSVILIVQLSSAKSVVSREQQTDIDIVSRLNVVGPSFGKLNQRVLRACPADFVFITAVNGCYQVISNKMDWSSAGIACKGQHPDAHLLVIGNVAEQQAVANMLAHLHSVNPHVRSCTTGDPWSAMWMAGQRVDPYKNTPFVWKFSSANGPGVNVAHIAYSHWSTGEPNFHGGVESCMSLLNHQSYTWNDAPCGTAYCSVCEIDLH